VKEVASHQSRKKEDKWEQAAGKEEEKDSYQEEAKESCLCT